MENRGKRARVIPPPGGRAHYYETQGYRIHFPYKPHECQHQMMSKIISSVSSDNRETCTLESATGTGKTLSLICALLAWQKDECRRADESVPKKSKLERSPSPHEDEPDSPYIPTIFYATRTLAHIKHIISQLRLTAYSDTPMGIYASVAQICDNESTAPVQYEEPEDFVYDTFEDEHNCVYNAEHFNWAEHLSIQDCKAWDIEDLKEFCLSNGTCPYFELLQANKDAKIIFCTYNYLLHPGIRQTLEIDLDDNILVFDEGHNVEEVSRAIASSQPGFLTLTKVSNVKEILCKATKSPNLPAAKKQALRNISRVFRKLEKYLICKSEEMDVGDADNILVQQDIALEDIIDDLTDFGVGEDDLPNLWTDYFTLKNHYNPAMHIPEAARLRIDRKTMIHISNTFSLFGFLCEGHSYFPDESPYKILLIERVPMGYPFDAEKETELQLICLNPAVGYKSIMDAAHTVILASGTPSATSKFSQEVDTHCTKKAYPGHVIPPERVFSAVIDRYTKRSPDLNFSSAGLEGCKDETFADLGNIIEHICLLVPHGLVVFLPSKNLMTNLKSQLRRSELLKNIRRSKDAQCSKKHKLFNRIVFFETYCKLGQEATVMLEEYKAEAETETGAILFAVMRGKLSEGIDLRDNQARALVTVGIPFMPRGDAFVKEKRRYEDNQDFGAGWSWYCSNAFQALNQAIGRGIRHAQDWCAVFIIDSRFSNPELDYEAKLPQWVRKSARNNVRKNGTRRSFTHILPGLEGFVSEMEA